MLDFLRGVFEASPMLALFTAMGTGYAIGMISFFGLSFGAGAVLFSGLVIGAIAPDSAPPGLVGTLGLLLFLYGVGIQYGPQFVAGLRGTGLIYNLLAAVSVLAALGVSALLAGPLGISLAGAAGMFAGTGTSTATLQAALAATGVDDAAIGYAVAYPFGVIFPILLMTLMARWVKPTFATPPPNLRFAEVTLGAAISGRTVGDISKRFPEGMRVVAVRHDHQNTLPVPEDMLHPGDGLLLLGPPAAVDAAIAELGQETPGRLAEDRQDFDLVRAYVSKASFIGKPAGDQRIPGMPMTITHVRRGDVDLPVGPDLTLEWGDRVVVAAPAGRLEEVRRFFGDSIRGAAELSFVSMGIGMAAGLVLGLIPIPFPGVGTFSLGIGGPLVVALILGWLGRTGPINWRMPAAANMVLRNLGLSIFIANVAIGVGAPFVDTVVQEGPALLFASALVVTVMAGGVLLLGHFVLRIPMDALLGVCAGATGNPAILATANRLAPTDKPDVGYATVFPTMTIVKIVSVQVLLS